MSECCGEVRGWVSGWVIFATLDSAWLVILCLEYLCRRNPKIPSWTVRLWHILAPLLLLDCGWRLPCKRCYLIPHIQHCIWLIEYLVAPPSAVCRSVSEDAKGNWGELISECVCVCLCECALILWNLLPRFSAGLLVGAMVGCVWSIRGASIGLNTVANVQKNVLNRRFFQP